MMMMVMMVMMMMMICLCFFAAVGFAGFALVFCFSSGAALGVEGVWPLLTHVILAAALESFWLKHFGSSFFGALAQARLSPSGSSALESFWLKKNTNMTFWRFGSSALESFWLKRA